MTIDSGQLDLQYDEVERSGGLDRLDRAGQTANASDPASLDRFKSELGKAIGEVDKLQVAADTQADAVAHGAGNLHEMALALEKADVAMRLAMRIRNKLVDTYNDIMKMGM
ncbi:MAG: flagellar hook-basal body complex protein FliE [Polyangia bacterium]|jgi:flagellar hook-basal body complex protein FliE